VKLAPLAVVIWRTAVSFPSEVTTALFITTLEQTEYSVSKAEEAIGRLLDLLFPKRLAEARRNHVGVPTLRRHTTSRKSMTYTL
jgi:hypothetical protein